MIYVGFESWKHKTGVKFGHEASLVTTFGLCLSGLALLFEGNDTVFTDMMEFNGTMFFYFVLPPIVFAAGFNMQRQKFFENITNVVLFGILGTFIAFSVYIGITILFTNYFEMTKSVFNKQTGMWESYPLDLEISEIIVMCALLCSSDVIAAVSLISPKEQPKLFSVVFGEGIVNDAVAIILFNTVVDFTQSGKPFTGRSIPMVGLSFSYLLVMSFLVGLAFGMICSWCFKYLRSLTKSSIVECALIFIFAYLSYIVSEMTGFSGIISLLTSGVFMAAYAWYNLSPQGRTGSTVTFSFIAFLAEGFVFSYLGLTFFSYRQYTWSWQLILVLLLAILVGRACGSMGLIGLLKMCKYESGNPNGLTFKELVFIWYAGMIRGAIAFGLVLKIGDDVKNKELITTTCLALVVFTTIVFGSTVGLLSDCLFGKENAEKKKLLKQ